MKILRQGKKGGGRKKRQVFGFLCKPGLIVVTKSLASELEMPIYVIAEHALQLGGAQIYMNSQDEVLKKKLMIHLNQEHLIVPYIEGLTKYDKDIIDIIRHDDEAEKAHIERVDEITKLMKEYRISYVDLKRLLFLLASVANSQTSKNWMDELIERITGTS
jgi:hypothetical protein